MLLRYSHYERVTSETHFVQGRKNRPFDLCSQSQIEPQTPTPTITINMHPTIPTLLVALVVATTWASPLVCPYSTSGGLFFLKLTLDLDIGNASCSAEQLVEMYENFQNALKLENSTMSDQSTALIKGTLCGANTNMTNRRLLVQTYSWSGTASEYTTCRSPVTIFLHD